jgi:hypothetical protein
MKVPNSDYNEVWATRRNLISENSTNKCMDVILTNNKIYKPSYSKGV